MIFWKNQVAANDKADSRILDLNINSEERYWVKQVEMKNKKIFIISSYVAGSLRTRPLTSVKMKDWINQAQLIQSTGREKTNCTNTGSLFIGNKDKKIVAEEFCPQDINDKKSQSKLKKLVDEIRKY